MMETLYETNRLNAVDDNNPVRQTWLIVEKTTNDHGDEFFSVTERRNPHRTLNRCQPGIGSLDEAIAFAEGTVDDILSAQPPNYKIEGSRKRGNIMLPNLGCDYVKHYHDEENSQWIVEYTQKEGMHTQALKDTGIKMPCADSKIVKKLQVEIQK